MMAKANTFQISQGIDPRYLQSILTKDVTVLEAIYDLVDNSIDAARDRLLKKRVAVDAYGLPASYDGLQISLSFQKDTVTFQDNGSGIAEESLSNRVFVIGAETHHRFGLGWFGIGLKRSLIRLGKAYRLETDDGKTSSKIEFSASDMLDRPDIPLVGLRSPSKGKPSTTIHISDLREGVQHDVNAKDWHETLSKNLARRYGIFVAKGMKLIVNRKPVASFGPSIRTRGPIGKKTAGFPIKDGVRVFIDSGMHADYRLTSEKSYEAAKKKIKTLSDQYGWYFVCNDRIVEVAQREKRLGWKTSWHPEYNGFVGWVRFVAEDPEALPWD